MSPVWSNGGRGEPARASKAGFRIEIAGSNHDLCGALAEACEAAGYARAVPAPGNRGRDRLTGPQSPPVERVLTIMDVAVLEPDWPERLERVARKTGR